MNTHVHTIKKCQLSIINWKFFSKSMAIALCLIASACFTASAQETTIDSTQTEKKGKKEYEMKTLFGGKSKMAHGGYMGATVMGTQLNNEDALLVGGRLAWVINHRFAFGVVGYGLSNNIDLDLPNSGNSFDELDLGYGGLLLEPIVGSKWPVHLSFPIMVGAGGAGLRNDRVRYYDDVEDDWVNYSTPSDAFFVVEPGVEVEANVCKFFRVAVGASYRRVEGLNLGGLKSDAFDGVSAGVTLKLGWF